ncbi:MAG: glycosylhydrolase-like jelly roll fold domain-containing protein, partial [Acidobacteriaceae bacterium]
DRELQEMVRSVFGDDTGKTTSSLRRSAAGGKAYFFPRKVEGKPQDYWRGSKDSFEPKISPPVEAAIGVIKKVVPKDLRILAGPTDRLFFNHMVRHGIDFYWIVNGTNALRTNTILIDQKGVPERWQPDTGKRVPIFFHETAAGTEVRLRLEPGDGAYLLFKPKGIQDSGACKLVASNLDEFHVAGRSSGNLQLAVQSEARPGANFADLSCDGVNYRGKIDISPSLKPLVLPGPWKFKLVGEPVETPYARTAIDPDGSAGTQWAATGFGDSAWKEQWVSPEIDSIRDWWALGAFDDTDYHGLYTQLPLEKNVDLKASYKGAGGASIHWKLLKSPSYSIDLIKPFPNQFVDPNLQKPHSFGYLLTYIHSPDSREVEVGVADPNFAAWVNGKRIALQDFRGFYSEPRQAWATFSKVPLTKGWNSLLIKFARWQDLTVWVKDTKSPVLSPLGFSPTRTLTKRSEDAAGFRWYRYVIPPGTSGMVLPDVGRPLRTFIDGKPVEPDANGVIHYVQDSTHSMIAALRIAGTNEIYNGPKFLLGDTPMNLVDWASVGLKTYSGDAVYQTDFTLPQAFLQQRVELDLGEVGVAARLKVNGHDVGYRVWKPFQFDITPWVHSGKNHLEVLVTNSAANKRDVGKDHQYIKNVHPNGLLGPVRILPFLDRNLLLSRAQ